MVDWRIRLKADQKQWTTGFDRLDFVWGPTVFLFKQQTYHKKTINFAVDIEWYPHLPIIIAFFLFARLL
ncbi:hypothetical protein DXB82_17675 [Phocaeicola vulgatus]|jgi:hypothetical protein|nr:hypothetical protein DXB90_19585 [Phocaeicola vulgatus]RGN01424.1 hypothetical protein DXB82_17675 [Phocaeicola vulgatus]